MKYEDYTHPFCKNTRIHDDKLIPRKNNPGKMAVAASNILKWKVSVTNLEKIIAPNQFLKLFMDAYE